MNFTEASVKNFRSDFNDMVKALEEKYGVTVDLGTIHYSGTELTANIKVEKTDNESQEKIWLRERNAVAWKQPSVGKIEYGKEYKGADGFMYKVTGFNSRRPKYCLEIERNGKKAFAPAGFLVNL